MGLHCNLCRLSVILLCFQLLLNDPHLFLLPLPSRPSSLRLKTLLPGTARTTSSSIIFLGLVPLTILGPCSEARAASSKSSFYLALLIFALFFNAINKHLSSCNSSSTLRRLDFMGDTLSQVPYWRASIGVSGSITSQSLRAGPVYHSSSKNQQASQHSQIL